LAYIFCALHEFDLLIRSRRTSGLHGIGVHVFARPLIEGRLVEFEGTTWNVVRVDLDRTPKVAVLELEVSTDQGDRSHGQGHAPRVGRA
jgi:hypothetical protein